MPSTAAEKRADEVIKKENMSQIVKMRRAGMSFGQIAEELMVSTTTAYNLYKEAMELMMIGIDEDVLEVRKLIIQRTNDAINAIYDKVLDGDIAAIEQMRKLNAELAAMTGANAPVKVDVTSKGEAIGPEMLQNLQRRAKREVDEYEFGSDEGDEKAADTSGIRRVSD